MLIRDSRDTPCIPREELSGISTENLAAVPDDLFTKFVLNLHYELRWSCSLRMFMEIARGCRYFDLREMFTSVEDRSALATLLCLGCMEPAPALQDGTQSFRSKQEGRDGKSLFPVDEFIAPEGSVEVPMLENYHGEHDKESPLIAEELWKKKMVYACDNFEARGFGSLKAQLNVFSAAQLRWLCVETARILKTPLGRFFEKYIRHIDSDDSLSNVDPNNTEVCLAERLAFDNAMYSLCNLCTRRPHIVTSTLNKLDVEKFIKKKPFDRATLLSKLMDVGTDMPRGLISNFDAERCKLFFRTLELCITTDKPAPEEYALRAEEELIRLLGGHD